MKVLVIVCLSVLAAFAKVTRAESGKPYAGFPEVFGNERITNGQDAARHAYPYQASVFWGDGEATPSRHVCGAAIISELWVLTAAHCFTELPDYGEFAIHAGKHVITVTEFTEQKRDIELRVIHPDYAGGVNPHDIAVVKLSSPLDFNSVVGSISLPPQNFVHIGNTVLTGWGSVSLSWSHEGAIILQRATVPLVSTPVCWHALNNIVRNPPLDPTTLDNVCTGPLDGSRVSICRGDSGGPLAQEVGGVWQLVGLVSWVIFPCGTIGAPSVYVRVSPYINWINEQIAANS